MHHIVSQTPTYNYTILMHSNLVRYTFKYGTPVSKLRGALLPQNATVRSR